MSSKNILIVDDNQDLADGLAIVLEDESYCVSVAYNGTDAINVLDKNDFSITFIDIKLPDMNGMELFQYIHTKSPHTNVIMMTGYRVEQMLTEVIGTGDVEIVCQPSEIKHVVELVNNVKNESIILVTDIDRDFIKGITNSLNDHGMKSIVADESSVALEQSLSEPVDVLILDLNKPITHGLHIYLQLKNNGRAVKTIIVSNQDENVQHKIDTLKSVSATGCLLKPFDPEALVAIVQNMML